MHSPARPQPSGAPRLSVLMPVYNEVDTVEQALAAVIDADVGVNKELVVVDDGSTDGPRELLQGLDLPDGVRLHLHPFNRGKGAAVRTALADARGEISTIFDADLEYDPPDIKLLLEPMLGGDSNAVFGVRAFEGHTSHSFLYVMGNRGVTLVANLLFNVYLRDVMTCHKAVRTEIFKSLPLRANGFDIEPEIAARLLQHGERIY